MKKIFALAFISLFVAKIFACTTFCINKNGQIVFGRNYDWVTGAGIVNTNQRGLFKTAVNSAHNESLSWVSKYGSITFNQYGKEFPTGGMNERGLVVEMMWLDGTVYPGGDPRPSVGVLQWIQYQLDNAANIDEVIASDSKLRITRKSTPLHYLIADAGGNVASIEFLEGVMVVHRDSSLPFPVLTNDTYASSAATAQSVLQPKGLDGNMEVSLENNSLDRFVKACSMVKKFHETKIDVPVTTFAFSILDKVGQGSFTKWSIVYDITNKKIYFKTEANKNIKTVSFTAFDLACSKPYKMFNMNQDVKGEVSSLFKVADKKIKAIVMAQVVAESSSRILISKKEEEELLVYEDGISCKK